ncbi:MAG: heme-copper oxidase subunit III [Haloarculaceae archaeon]
MAETGEEDGDHGVYMPATVDWPRGRGESSWWPFVTAIGVVVLYLGAGLFVVRESITGPFVYPTRAFAVFLGGGVVFATGLFGWFYQGFVVNYWAKSESVAKTKYRWGALLFVTSELTIFSGGFAYFALLRGGTWPTHPLPEVLSPLVWGITVVLSSSSFTLLFARRQLRKGNRRRFLALLGATPLLGIVFLAGQAYEYYDHVVVHGQSMASSPYFSAFFGLTGLHGLHTAFGVIWLLVVFARAYGGQYAPDRYVSLTTVSMYWWFVDTMWLIIMSVLYTSLHVDLGALQPSWARSRRVVGRRVRAGVGGRALAHPCGDERVDVVQQHADRDQRREQVDDEPGRAAKRRPEVPAHDPGDRQLDPGDQHPGQQRLAGVHQ